jgi:hypothetical protein
VCATCVLLSFKLMWSDFSSKPNQNRALSSLALELKVNAPQDSC